MTLPAVRIENGFRLVAHHTLDGAPNIGEGMAVKVTDDGRRLLYVANEGPPVAMSILDVTDARDPRLLWQLPCEHDQVRGNSLTLRGDTLLLAKQVKRPGLEPAGFHVFDLSIPDQPRELSFFDTSGPHSRGAHLVKTMDGRLAHVTTGVADFEPNHPKDDQLYLIVDLEDRERPREIGRWWLPGQRKGETPLERHTWIDRGFRPHHALNFPERPDRAYLGYIDGGVVILDVSDLSSPRMISRLDHSPPYPGFTHTVLPLFDREVLLVSDEANSGWDGADWPKRYWIVDVRDERNPVIISTLPVPEGFDELRREGGHIGAHNLHENEAEPGAAHLRNTTVATWFSAGLRAYDLRDPYTPVEIAAFLPETPDGQRGCRISDVFVDDRGWVFATDRARGGLYVLEYTGDVPLD